VYGLGKEVIDTAFVGSVSRIGGMSLADIQRETEAFWAKGFPDKALTKLDDYGFIQSRPKGEYHANNQVRPAPLARRLLRLLLRLRRACRARPAAWLLPGFDGALLLCLLHARMMLCGVGRFWAEGEELLPPRELGLLPAGTIACTAHPASLSPPPTPHPAPGHVQAAAQGHRAGRQRRLWPGRL
jgi:hypothetical protein